MGLNWVALPHVEWFLISRVTSPLCSGSELILPPWLPTTRAPGMCVSSPGLLLDTVPGCFEGEGFAIRGFFECKTYFYSRTKLYISVIMAKSKDSRVLTAIRDRSTRFHRFATLSRRRRGCHPCSSSACRSLRLLRFSTTWQATSTCPVCGPSNPRPALDTMQSQFSWHPVCVTNLQYTSLCSWYRSSSDRDSSLRIGFGCLHLNTRVPACIP